LPDGLARPDKAPDTIERSRAFAFASATPNTSMLTTPDSRPGRSHSATRTTSSLRWVCPQPSGLRIL
jgi:hypothetical protein